MKAREIEMDKEIKEIVALCEETKKECKEIKILKFLAELNGVPFNYKEIKKVTKAIDNKYGHVILEKHKFGLVICIEL